jgi:autotransporter-associated beta strand protein
MLARRSLFSALAVSLLASPALSQPVSIPVPNYDFSSPYVAKLPPYAVAGVSDWVQSPPPANWNGGTQGWVDTVGVFVNVPQEWIDNLVPSGGTSVHQQAAFMFSTPGLQLSQTLSSTFQIGASYQLAVGIEGGGQGMVLGCPMEIGLYYLDAGGNQVMVGTTTVLNDLTLSGSANSYITHLPDRYLSIPPVTASDPWAGQNIGIALLQTATPVNEGGYWDINNVRLTTSFPALWTGAAGNTNWSDSGNWTNGVPSFAAATAVINAPAASPIAVTLDSPQSVGTLMLGSTNGTAVTISGTGGDTLTLNDWGSGAMILALSGTHEIAAPVVLADDLTVSGSGMLAFGVSSNITDNGRQYSLTMSGTGGTLILSGSNNYSGGTNVYAGTLIATSPTAIPDGSALSIGVGGTFVVGSSQVLAAPSDAAVSAVPEPGTLVLFVAVAAVAAGVVCHRLIGHSASAARFTPAVCISSHGDQLGSYSAAYATSPLTKHVR